MPISGLMDLQGASPWSRPRTPADGTALQRWPLTRSDYRAELPSSAFSNLAERGVALVMLVLLAPLMALFAMAVLLLDGRPVLYRGERLGLQKRRFMIFKFRTLRRGAERQVTARPIDPRDGLEIRGGRLLRETRLDELPQLWNIVLGEMSFVGPRPERPQVYQALCRGIPGYDQRFRARPGLIGPSQLFTPHGTYKRIRASIDNAWVRKKKRWWETASLTLYAPIVMVRKLVTHALEHNLVDLVRARLLRRYSHKRKLRRVRHEAAVVVFLPGREYQRGALARLVDINDDAFRIHSPSPIEVGSAFHVRLEIDLEGGKDGRKVRRAHCLAVVVQRRRRVDGHVMVMKYWPLTPFSHYVILQYFLEDSLAPPRARAARNNRLSAREAVDAVSPTPVSVN